MSLPIHTRLTFLDKGKNKNDLLLQVFRVGGNYSKAWRIGVCLDTCKPISLSFISKCIEKKNLYRFPLCSGMWPESISLNHQFINLQGYDIRTKEGWKYVLLYSTDGSPTDSTVSLSATSAVFYKIYSINAWIVPYWASLIGKSVSIISVECTWAILKPFRVVVRRNIYHVKTLDCKIYHHGQKFKIDDFFVVWESLPFNAYYKTHERKTFHYL